MCRTRALLLLCLATISFGCDESPITAPDTQSQAIVGQVISQEFGIEVSAWQAQLVKSTMADSAGYFTLDQLPVGLYEVRLVTPSGRRLSIKSVPVGVERTTSLREIRLSPPFWPIVDVQPSDSTRGVRPLTSSIRIITTTPIEMSSLQSQATFSPALSGAWISDSYYSGSSSYQYYYYEFLVNGSLEVATKYTLRIGPELTMASGQKWGDSLLSVFFTDSLRMMNLLFASNYGGNSQLVQPRRDFGLYAQFNASVDPDSLTKATSFNPSIQGVWLANAAYLSGGLLRFFHTGDVGLGADQTYVMNIAGDVPLAGSSTTSGNLTFTFRTDRLRVINSNPGQGQAEYCGDCQISLLFNSEMDSASTAAGFSLETFHGTPVAGTLSWIRSDQVTFTPDSAMASSSVYVARLSTGASSLWGDHLEEPFELYFRIR